ncbi:hypothetical protein [Chryseobacterium geocarposphaerae]|uniref:Lipoprotein n=1 Tax=Chryseobacterium geocarposphaerae TaxID=1416776 RepID=A0A2M9CBN8_9FLAO|nr:hypothetical protein [Chryseobacterium geocarposphaerae]PJJ68192.1 hypothetical protein CLV73_2227 [Chryseobacterium geocarposphaerae]
MKNTFSIVILLLLVSCSNKEITKEKDQQLKYSFDNILSYNNQDTLFIKSRFADCGEWGGHEEIIKIYRSERKVKLTYLKYKVNCGNRDNLGSIIQIKDITNTITLSNSQQTNLMNYINNLMKLKFINPEFSNAGTLFSVEDNKGTLKLSKYGNNIHLLNNYNTLMINLGFSKVVIESK